MIFRYKREYSLFGRGRVERTYHGIRALAAIGFDLAMGLVFGLVGLAFWLVRRIVSGVVRLAFALVTLPFRTIRAIAVAHERRRAVKPVWAGAGLDEL